MVPHRASHAYDVVADVESYPSFLPGCTGARSVAVGDGVVDASLRVQKGPFRHWLTTRNTHHPRERITLALVEGPFRFLEGEWRFDETGRETRISLVLEFELASRIADRLLAPAFAEMASRMVEAFAGRARELGSSPEPAR